MAEREKFGSGAAVMMAMAGSAIGLGNIWRFPYMVGEYGGAAFVVVYLLATVLLSIPILLSETVIGRHTHLGTVGSIDKIVPGSRLKLVGYLTVLSPLIILSFYSVVGGWSIQFTLKSVTAGFGADATSIFGSFISSVWGPLACHTAFLLATALIVSAGVKGGIEKFNKVCLPVLFVLIVAMAVYSVSLPGASEGVRYLVKPDFSKLSAKSLSYAMGQSFFSLSLGVGTVLTYASYMKNENSMLGTAFGTAIFDVLFAILAGFAVMPAVFAAGLEPAGGPGLIFESVPFIFSSMGAAAPLLSRIISIVFFVTIVIAALTSSISMYEVGVAYLVENHRFSRRKAVIVIFLGTWALGILCSLSFGPLSGVHILGRSIFDFCDALTSNVLMTLGSLMFVFIAGWKMSREDVRREFGGSRLFKPFYFMIRYVAPLGILLIFFTNIFV